MTRFVVTSGVVSDVGVICNHEGTYARRHALLNTADDLDTADVAHGRIACFTRGDLGSAGPQLMFTYDAGNILGVNENDGIAPPTQ